MVCCDGRSQREAAHAADAPGFWLCPESDEFSHLSAESLPAISGGPPCVSESPWMDSRKFLEPSPHNTLVGWTISCALGRGSLLPVALRFPPALRYGWGLLCALRDTSTLFGIILRGHRRLVHQCICHWQGPVELAGPSCLERHAP